MGRPIVVRVADRPGAWGSPRGLELAPRVCVASPPNPAGLLAGQDRARDRRRPGLRQSGTTILLT